MATEESDAERHGKSTAIRASSCWQSFRMGNRERHSSVEDGEERIQEVFVRELCENSQARR